jgi:hypothetical protein
LYNFAEWKSRYNGDRYDQIVILGDVDGVTDWTLKKANKCLGKPPRLLSSHPDLKDIPMLSWMGA